MGEGGKGRRVEGESGGGGVEEGGEEAVDTEVGQDMEEGITFIMSTFRLYLFIYYYLYCYTDLILLFNTHYYTCTYTIPYLHFM